MSLYFSLIICVVVVMHLRSNGRWRLCMHCWYCWVFTFLKRFGMEAEYGEGLKGEEEGEGYGWRKNLNRSCNISISGDKFFPSDFLLNWSPLTRLLCVRHFSNTYVYAFFPNSSGNVKSTQRKPVLSDLSRKLLLYVIHEGHIIHFIPSRDTHYISYFMDSP